MCFQNPSLEQKYENCQKYYLEFFYFLLQKFYIFTAMLYIIAWQCLHNGKIKTFVVVSRVVYTNTKLKVW